jgi:hypothetical protein
MAILISAIFLIFFFVGVPLIKKKTWNELTVVIVLLMAALTVQLCKSLNMITPIGIIEKIFEPVGKIIFKQY